MVQDARPVPQGELVMTQADQLFADGHAVDAHAFVRIACDPARSVTVRAVWQGERTSSCPPTVPPSGDS